MLFNSYEFIFGFLPVTIAGFLLLGSMSRRWALGWLVVASVLFYTWWRPFNLLIIGPSLVVNYVIARALLRLAADETKARARTAVLALGVVFNLGVLGYFKYANFAVVVAGDLTGRDFVIEQIILPLGISFITFQKIAFLIDVAGRRVERFTASDFMLFVLFFPQLIAGPIVHFRETMPQFHAARCKYDPDLFALGLTLFCFGLFKKVVLADGVAVHVTPIYELAAAGGVVTLIQAWLAAVGFTLQIYFDFSGYSDMACGAALFFGVRLPLNFDSPLKATNIIDFWLRWHVTLTRFLTAYVYNPVTLALTRRRSAKRLSLLRRRESSVRAFVVILAGPTLFTMFVSGVWHGAGYTFIVWGLLHGLFLVVNHAWRQYAPARAEGGPARARLAAATGFALTFLAVAVAMVYFRAPDIGSATHIAKGMIGLNGLSLPDEIAGVLGLSGVPAMERLDGEVFTRELIASLSLLAVLLAIALAMPNSLQVLGAHKPVIEAPDEPPTIAWTGRTVAWRPTLPWLALVAALAAVAVPRIAGESEFLYWQF